MNKKQIRLTESDLKQIVKESVQNILNETQFTIYPYNWQSYSATPQQPKPQQTQVSQQQPKMPQQPKPQQTQVSQQQPRTSQQNNADGNMQQYKQKVMQYCSEADNWVNMALGAIDDGDYQYVKSALNKIKDTLTPIYMGKV